MKSTSLVFVLLLAFAINFSAHATPQVDTVEQIIPTQMCGDYFLIPLEVDLDGDGVPTTLMAIFDTGGAGLHIDPDAVVRAGGSPVAVRKQITIRNATAGPLTIRKLRPYTRHLDHLSQALGMEIDIFLPFRAFEDYLLTLDFPRQEMRVVRGRLPRPDGVELFSARGPDRRPYIDTDIVGRTHRLLIDSGSSGSISLHPGRELPWLSTPLPISVGQGMEHLRFAEVGRLDADLQLAGVKIAQPIVKIGQVTELIGTDVMRRFAWTFDQRSRRVRIRPDSSAPLHMSATRGTGAVLIPHSEGYEVVRVLADTPAERAGLHVGDVIVAVDGTRVLEQDCDKRAKNDRVETTLTLLRDGKTFDRRVEIVDLVP